MDTGGLWYPMFNTYTLLEFDVAIVNHVLNWDRLTVISALTV